MSTQDLTGFRYRFLAQVFCETANLFTLRGFLGNLSGLAWVVMRLFAPVLDRVANVWYNDLEHTFYIPHLKGDIRWQSK